MVVVGAAVDVGATVLVEVGAAVVDEVVDSADIAALSLWADSASPESESSEHCTMSIALSRMIAMQTSTMRTICMLRESDGLDSYG